MRSWRTFWHDETGATLVEFGLIGGPFLLTLMAVLAIGLNFFMVASLDRATLVGARAVTTGNVSTVGMSASDFRTKVICPALPSPLFDCNSVFVNMSVVAAGSSPSGFYNFVKSDKSALKQPQLDNTKTTFCPGAASQYVVLQVLYPTPYFVPFLTPASATTYNGQKVNVMMSSITFMSEPYSGAATYTGC